MFSLAGRVAVITGAGGLLGRAMSLALADAGSGVALVDRDLDGAQNTAALLEGKGVRVRAYRCDIAVPAQVCGLAAAVEKDFGRIDVLVNNAGVFHHDKAEELDFAGWRRVMATNLDGTFLMCQAFGKSMIARQRGSIINIASKSGLTVDVPNCQAAYNTSKAGIIMLTKSLAVEWGPHNVRVNCICPGNFVAGPALRGGRPGNALEERWLLSTPLGHFGLPQELGGALIYLASDASSFTTGAAEVVDGGYTIV